MFYFAQLIIKLKKFFEILGNRRLRLEYQRAQTTVEYFLIFAAVAAIAFLVGSAFYNKSQEAVSNLFNASTNAIVGETVVPGETSATEGPGPVCEDSEHKATYHSICSGFSCFPGAVCSPDHPPGSPYSSECTGDANCEHHTCLGLECARFAGPGESDCVNSDDCGHNACANGSCVILLGKGDGDECTSNEECNHTECSVDRWHNRATCINVAEPGIDQCTTDAECAHTECSGTACITVLGPGTSQCTDSTPGPTGCSHRACGTGNPTCSTVAGSGPNECATSPDCGCLLLGTVCTPGVSTCCDGRRCVIPPCFTSGTLILTPKGKTPIEKLAQGDEVFSVDTATYQRVPKKVVAVHQHVTDKILQIGLSNGTSVQVTPEHPFFDPQKGRYRPIGSFRVGDKVVMVSEGDKFKTEEVKIVSKKMLREKNTPVYNITVEKPFENYIAEGIIVHNKPPATCE
jgi:hypothetical protein